MPDHELDDSNRPTLSPVSLSSSCISWIPQGGSVTRPRWRDPCVFDPVESMVSRGLAQDRVPVC